MNPLLSDHLTPQYSTEPLPKATKKTPEEIKQRIEELKAIIKRDRELEEGYAMDQKASDLLPVFLHLYEQYLGWIEEWNADCKIWRRDYGAYEESSFEGFMQYLVQRNKEIQR